MRRGLHARDSVSTAGNGSLARLAVPDTNGLAADGDLAAEGASILGVLGDFHLLDLLSQGGTVTISNISMACIGVVLQARVSSVCISLGNGEFRL